MVSEDVLRAIPEDAEDDGGSEAAQPDRFLTSTGVLFKLKSIPPLLIIDAQRQFKEPTPPKIPNLDKDDTGGVLEENPNDPNYLRELYAHRQRIGETSNAIMLTRGTEVLRVADGVDALDDPGWAADVEDLAGITVPKVGRRRYYCWLKYVVLGSMDDFQGILRKLSNIGGVTAEEDVADATASFRAPETGDSVNGVPPAEEV